MSMLSSQCDELREAAGRLEGYQNGEISRMLREAADTITSLWNSLTASEVALNKAAGNWAKADSQIRENQSTRWHDLFGTPEMAARTLVEIKCGAVSCKGCPIAEPCAEWDVMLDDGKALQDALLEWLRSDA